MDKRLLNALRRSVKRLVEMDQSIKRGTPLSAGGQTPVECDEEWYSSNRGKSFLQALAIRGISDQYRAIQKESKLRAQASFQAEIAYQVGCIMDVTDDQNKKTMYDKLDTLIRDSMLTVFG